MNKYKGIDVSGIDLDSLTPEELAELQKQIDEDNKNLTKTPQKKVDASVPEGLKSSQAQEMSGYKPNSSFVLNADEDVPDGLTVDALKKYKMPVAKPELSKDEAAPAPAQVTPTDAGDDLNEVNNAGMYRAKRNTYDVENLLNKQADLNLLEHRRYNAPIWNPQDTDVITDKLKSSIELTPEGNEPFQAEANRLASKRISDVNMLQTLRSTYNTMAQKAAMDKLNAQTYDKNVDISNQRVGVADKRLSVASSDLKGALNGQDAVIYDENGYARPNPNYVPSQHRKALNLPKANWNGTDPDVNASVAAALKEKTDEYNSRLSDRLSAAMDAETTRNMADQAEQQAAASALGTENVRNQHNDFAKETPFAKIPEGKFVFNDSTGEVVPAKEPSTDVGTKFVFNDSTGEVEPAPTSSTNVAPAVTDKVPKGLKANAKKATPKGNQVDSENAALVKEANDLLFRINSSKNKQAGSGSYVTPPSDAEINRLSTRIKTNLNNGGSNSPAFDYFVPKDVAKNFQKGSSAINKDDLLAFVGSVNAATNRAMTKGDYTTLVKGFANRWPGKNFGDYFVTTQNKDRSYTVVVKPGIY